MKRKTRSIIGLLLIISMVALAGCGSKTEDPGPPPSDVINPGNSTGDNMQSENDGTVYDGDVLENAVSVRIG